jgi:benzylsuccinate CoA-transferase BbsF subunit
MSAASGSRPFEGIKVLDFTMYGAGPFTVNYLAYFGAEVVKVESRARPDGCRLIGPHKDGKADLEHSAYFAYSNPSRKRGITLNLGKPEGVEIARRLASWADVVVESFAGGTMEKWGLGYEDLRKVNPDIVMLRTCVHGQTGPLARQPGFGNQLTSLSGFNSIMGWPDRTACGFDAQPFTDHLAPLFCIPALIAALDYKERTGKGQCLDVSQHEASIQILAPLILDYGVNGRLVSVNGNRREDAAPHGVYRCRGEDRWCAIAVFSDDEWRRLVEVMGSPARALDRRFADLPGRKRHEDELDDAIGEWTAGLEAREVMESLQRAGVSAGIVADASDQASDPQYAHYGFFREIDHPAMGRTKLFHGPAFALSDESPEVACATMLGEGNEYVYGEILGMGRDEIERLKDEDVI